MSIPTIFMVSSRLGLENKRREFATECRAWDYFDKMDCDDVILYKAQKLGNGLYSGAQLLASK